jgi:DNA (cytosine-5)-methyltransferase 1
MSAYYNEFDPKAAAWLRELIKGGHIAPGDVDERDITDVPPDDLKGYAQCHFFAGIGGWSYALRLAGWPDDRAVWTGSCPCQPFSAAGKGGGVDDERHLWPAFFHLIDQCRPRVIFGEQVASKDGLGWLDLVQADLEGAGYASAAVDLCAAGVGAPHIRQRLYFVADTDSGNSGRGPSGPGPSIEADAVRPAQSGRRGVPCDVGETVNSRLEGLAGDGDDGSGWPSEVGSASKASAVERMEHDEGNGRQQRRPEPGERRVVSGRGQGELADTDGGDTSAQREQRSGQYRFVPQDSWACEYIPCSDGKARPVEPGLEPLAHGIPGRVGLLRGYGNAIVPQVAAAFIESYLGII